MTTTQAMHVRAVLLSLSEADVRRALRECGEKIPLADAVSIDRVVMHEADDMPVWWPALIARAGTQLYALTQTWGGKWTCERLAPDFRFSE